MTEKRIAGAGIDCTVEEPLPASSPLWALDNALITPHTAGETRRYEDNVIDLLLENLDRLWRGETTLRNQVVDPLAQSRMHPTARPACCGSRSEPARRSTSR